MKILIFEKNGTKDKSLLNDEKYMNSLTKWFSKRVRQELFLFKTN